MAEVPSRGLRQIKATLAFVERLGGEIRWMKQLPNEADRRKSRESPASRRPRHRSDGVSDRLAKGNPLARRG